MTKSNHFSVEYAKSNMATCRVCMAKVVKDALRIGHIQADLENDAAPAEGGDTKEADRLQAVAGATRWHHFECFPRMKGAKWMAANLPANAGEINGFADLKKADQKKLSSMWKAILGSSASPSSPGTKKRQASGTKKRKASELENSKPNGSAQKLAKMTSVQGVLTTTQFKKVQKLEEELSPKTTAQLQAELTKNSQVQSGKKEELVQRVAEGRVLGALPPCPKCKYGQVHWSRHGGWYSCPGYFDKEAKMRKRCGFRTKDLTRTPWQK